MNFAQKQHIDCQPVMYRFQKNVGVSLSNPGYLHITRLRQAQADTVFNR
jgi:hypothetical protein